MAINPLQAPINYAGMAPQINISKEFAEFGQVLAERQQRIQAQEAKEAYAADLQAVQANPTQEAFSGLILKYPQHREAFAEARKGYGDVAATNEFNQGYEVSMALENGSPEVARKKLIEIITARKDKNLPVGIYEQTLDALATGNTKGAQAGVNYALTMADPDRFKKQVDARAASLKLPSEVTEAAGKATEAEAKGKEAAGTVDANIAKAQALSNVAVATAPDLIAKAEAERKEAESKATVAGLDAEYGRTNAVLKVQELGAKLGLTQAQIKQAEASVAASNAAAKKDGAEAARAQAQANQIALGIIPVENRPEIEAKFRKEYSDQTKGYQDVKSAYGRILAVSDPKSPDEEAAADLALIFNFMKMQDPGSTINTGEFANAQNAAGVPDRIRNAYNNLVTGGRLNPTQRKSFRGQAENLYKVAGQQDDIVRKGITRIAKGYGLNIENIFYSPTNVDPTAPAGTSAAPPAAGQRNVTVDY